MLSSYCLVLGHLQSAVEWINSCSQIIGQWCITTQCAPPRVVQALLQHGGHQSFYHKVQHLFSQFEKMWTQHPLFEDDIRKVVAEAKVEGFQKVKKTAI